MRLSGAVLLLSVCCSIHSDVTAIDLTQTIGRFTVNLFEALQPKTTNNYILSPLSVLTDLSMALLGAQGTTADELLAGLQLDATSSPQQIADTFRAFLLPLQPNSSCLRIVNRIYVNDQFAIKPQFNALAAGSFFATAQPLDIGQPARAAGQINAYVAANTNHVITNLVDGSQFSEATRLVLINAVYFKAQWLYPFEQRSTRKEVFHLQSDGRDAGVPVDFMHAARFYWYAELTELDAILVGLPYETDGYVLNVLLPNAGGGLKQLMGRLHGGDLSQLSAGASARNIQLSMPKFAVRQRLDLKGPLQRLGVRKAFTQEADFSDLLEQAPNTGISDVVHEAYITVDENGTEAAAATAVKFRATSAIRRPAQTALVVKFNRPFAYYIQDRATNVIFYGQYIGK